MENNNNILEKNKDQKKDDLYRVTVNREGERALAAIVERVNDGFIGGRVNRTQVASWVLIKFSENTSENEINQIRAEHFDEIAVLECILRQAKESGQVPPEFKSLLQKRVSIGDNQKKRITKKALTNNIINDDI